MSKIALLVGINYYGTTAELRGCINDTININNYLINNLSFDNKNIYRLTDNNGINTPDKINPTKMNIINHLNLIVKRIKNENITHFFIFYSGHGSNVYDLNGDEKDNMDEILIPVDYNLGNIIKDDELNNIIGNIPNDCKIFGIFDCCNSGTILDLKYKYISKKNNLIENNNNKLNKHNNICMISGCKDDQTSADFYNNNTKRFAGALTTSFLYCCKKLKYNNITFINLINKMRKYLKKNNFTQIPQITSNKLINNNTFFIKNNDLLIQYTPPPPPPPKPTQSKPPTKPSQSKPTTKPRRKLRFRNRREYLLYLRYLWLRKNRYKYRR